MRSSRSPRRASPGNFLIDDTFLAGEGVTDFEQYRVDPREPLRRDFLRARRSAAAARRRRSAGKGGISSASAIPLCQARSKSQVWTMTTLLITPSRLPQPSHAAGHPERPDRLRAIAQALEDEKFEPLAREPRAAAARDHRAVPSDGLHRGAARGLAEEGIVAARRRHLDVAGQLSRRRCARSAARCYAVDEV